MVDPATPIPPKPAGSGVVVPVRLKWHQRLAAATVYAISRLATRTWRVRFQDDSGLLTDPAQGPVIFSVWHNRLALSMCIWVDFVSRHRPAAKLAAMISASKDGGMLADVLTRYRVTPVRGSTSRRGRQALLEAARLLARGHDVAITPDGPRGPKYRVQDGILALAQLSGRPIIPVQVKIHWKSRLKSWDRFQIPWLGSRCEVVFRPAMVVPRDATEETRRELAVQLASAMSAVDPD